MTSSDKSLALIAFIIVAIWAALIVLSANTPQPHRVSPAENSAVVAGEAGR